MHSPRKADSSDLQRLALAGLTSLRLYFVGEAPAELRPTLPAEQGGLCIFNVANCGAGTFEAFLRDCAKTAIVPVTFMPAEHHTMRQSIEARRRALEKLIAAGCQVPVYTHAGTAQAAIKGQVEAKRKATQQKLQQEALEVAAIMSEGS